MNNVNDNVQMETEFMLTTIDNPFDYFEDFHSWYYYDISHNYNCCGLLARIAELYLSDDMTQKEKNSAIERAIDEIILYDFRNIYKKVKKTTEIVEPMTV